MGELRRRSVVRSTNNPIADIAEELVAQHYKGQRAISSQAGWDVDTGTEKLQVKAMRNTHYKRTTLSPIRSQNYDAVVVVVFNEDLTLNSAWYIPRAVIEASEQCARQRTNRPIVEHLQAYAWGKAA